VVRKLYEKGKQMGSNGGARGFRQLQFQLPPAERKKHYRNQRNRKKRGDVMDRTDKGGDPPEEILVARSNPSQRKSLGGAVREHEEEEEEVSMFRGRETLGARKGCFTDHGNT